MTDRQPTKILTNGAIRYGVYNTDGTLNHYEYLKREDAPTIEGTPLNKANLLSDATAAKLWPNASTRPEDPTVNDALGKLAEGTAKVGDIAITSRTDLSDAWLPCDGRTVSQEQYPSLCAVLRTPDNPAIWTEKTVSTNVGAGGDTLSHENGHWFRTYRDATSAHILVSDNGETWTEWMIPQNFWASSAILSSRVVAAHAVKYLGGLYVCSVCVLCSKSSEAVYYRGVLFASEIFGQFRVDTPSMWTSGYDSSLAEEFATKSIYDVHWDGQRFFVLGEKYSYSTYYTAIRYTERLTNKSSPAEPADNGGQAWTAGASLSTAPIGMYVRKTDGMIMILANEMSGGKYATKLYYAKSALSADISSAYIASGNYSYQDDLSDFLEVDGSIYVANKDDRGLKKITGSSTLTVSEVSSFTDFNYAINCNGQIVGTDGDTVFVTEDIEHGADYSTTLTLAPGNKPAAAGAIVRIPCSSSSAAVKDILHNFVYDNKKIPNITTDSRSGAYIKALED